MKTGGMRVKICGLTRREDVTAAFELNPWAIGFIFYKKSPRYVDPEAVGDFLKAFVDSSVLKVGVFVNASLEEIIDAVRRSKVTGVQLHGDETPAFCLSVKKALPRVTLIKAVRPDTRSEIDDLKNFKICDFIIIDSFSEKARGGTGTLARWDLAQKYTQSHDNPPLLLSGGLSEINLEEAVSLVKPFGVDLSSSLEISPGVKSRDKMRSLMNLAQNSASKSVLKSPDQNGRFEKFGGRFVPETLMTPILELEKAYEHFKNDENFRSELKKLLETYVGRETPLTFASRITQELGGAKIYLKREDLAHTGAHKINNALGQALLAQRMGKKRLIAETGAGQHGVATATVAALLGLECVVYMGCVDIERQQPNVHRMKLLGAEIIPVTSGSQTLKDAVSEAMRDWVSHLANSYYLLGSALGPHPYPMMVRDFQSVIGLEAREQILKVENRLPNELIACVGGGSNAIGLFYAFLNDQPVVMTGVEAGGTGPQNGDHAARFQGGAPGVFQGTYTYVLQSECGQIEKTHSVSAGLDYAAVGPEHAMLKESGRATYTSVTDDEALKAFHTLTRFEGIIPALESSHALAHAFKRAQQMSREQILLVGLSGRGDKDLATVLACQKGSHGDVR